MATGLAVPGQQSADKRCGRGLLGSFAYVICMVHYFTPLHGCTAALQPHKVELHFCYASTSNFHNEVQLSGGGLCPKGK